MKILFLSDAYDGGGAGRAASEMFTAMRAAGHHVEMLVASQVPGLPQGVRGARLKGEKYLRVFDSLSGGLSLDRRHIGSSLLLSKIRPDRFDVVHAHNILSKWLSLRALKAMANRLPFVWTFHDERPIILSAPYDLGRVMSRAEIFQRTPERYIAKIYDASGPESIRIRKKTGPLVPRPAAIITPSSYLAKMAMEEPRFATVPVHVVPNGLPFMHLAEAQMARNLARQQLDIDPTAKVVLIVASSLNSVYKGMWHAVEALARASREQPAMQVLIAGQPVEPLMAKIHEAQASLKVTALGYLRADAELARAYRAADVTLIPSVADNFPYVATESLACETPIVTFNVGGFPDLVGDNERGVMAREMTGASLAEALGFLFSNPDQRLRLGQAGRQWVLQVCDADRWINRHLEIYRSVMHGPVEAK